VNKNSGLSLLALLGGGLALLAACSGASSRPGSIGPYGGLCAEGQASCNVVEGYSGNSIAAGVSGATISGGGIRGAPNQVTANTGTVGGGEGNLAGEGSTVSGGLWNTAQYFNATVGGGTTNIASAEEATVGGGLKNLASGRFATVGGGAANTATDLNATVAGGSGNHASARYATVGGGTENRASSVSSAVAGGDHNLATGPYSAVLGGVNNTAGAYLATVGGGAGNQATGSYAAIPGGFANLAGGDYSFAAGREAKINPEDPGVFLFADSAPFDFPSLSPNEFAVRASGGVRFVTGTDPSGAPMAGVRLNPGSGSWETLSDYHAKSGLVPVDGQEILRRLMSVPIETWSYRAQDPSIRHIGPTAQDFHATFGLGTDDRYISTVDEEGVALAAIQELYRIVQRQNPALGPTATEQRQAEKIASLERRLTISNALAIVSMIFAIVALWKRGTPGLNRLMPEVRRRPWERGGEEGRTRRRG
jgi:hypothetical protein